MKEAQISRSQYRIPLDLTEWLDQRAHDNDRSRNGELVAILKRVKDEESAKAA